jgi:hypothetical protein
MRDFKRPRIRSVRGCREQEPALDHADSRYAVSHGVRHQVPVPEGDYDFPLDSGFGDFSLSIESMRLAD